MNKKITEAWMFVVVDENGDELVPAMATAMGMMPIVTTDEADLPAMREFVLKIAKELKWTLTLIKINGTREELEKIEP